jgi:drug/metabolite transporter (DMT)-like permease
VASLFFLSYSYLPTAEVVSKSNPAGLNILTNLIGGGVITLIAWVISPRAFDITPQGWTLIVGYSITFFVIGATLYFYAFKTIKPWVIASFLSLEVVFGLALAALLLKESIATVQFVGAAIVLAATIAIGRLAPRNEA